MNILIFTGYSGFTQRTHNFARLIKKDFPEIKISTLVAGGHNYEYLIKNNKNKIYENIKNVDSIFNELFKDKISYNDEHINFLEALTNRTLNKFLYSERVLIQHTHNLIYNHKLSREKALDIFIKLFFILEDFIKKNDIIFCYTSASLISEIIFSLCKIYNKQYLTLNEIRIDRKWSLNSNNMDYHDDIMSNYNNINSFSNKGEQLYSNFINSLETNKKNPVEMSYQKKLLDKKKINIKNISRFIFRLIFDKPENRHFLSPSGLKKIEVNYNFYLNFFRSKKYFENKLPNSKFLYYPLTTLPEASTLIRGVQFYDQLSNIKKISLNLPSNYILVVREHPGMIGKNSIDFYKNIKNIFNVFLLSPNYNNTEVIKKCNALITVSGTSGIEALFLGKKTIVLGDTIYSDLKSVIKLTNFSQLFSILKNEFSEAEIKKQIIDMKIFCESIIKTDLIYDDDLVLWTKKAFTSDIINFDRNFYLNFKKKFL